MGNWGDILTLEELKKKRKDAGFTQETLASEIGISRSTLSLFENGKRKPSYDVMKNISKALKEKIEI